MRKILTILVLFICTISMSAQVDKKDVRRGNRDFRKEDYKLADIDYRKALVKDSTSFAANYNLGNNEYRLGDGMEDAVKAFERIQPQADFSPYAADYYYNLGDLALASKDYQTAVNAFMQSLLRRPDDVDAKENYIYAKLMLENQQQNQDQNQNNDQNNDQNQDQNQDQNKNQDQNQDQNNNQDQNQDQDPNQDQNQNNNQDQQQQPQQQPQISPQAAQQMLQAIQQKEKETQDKVNKEKAAVMKSRQKEKNW